ncbi:MAG: transposase, partial [Chloroflexota bacterium]
MPYDPNKHRRRSIRLKNYDYSAAGIYFVTICVQHRESRFGRVKNGKMILNEAGQMVETEWQALPNRFGHIELDAFVVMPNHFHGILIITNDVERASTRAMQQRPRLGDMVGAFQSI